MLRTSLKNVWVLGEQENDGLGEPVPIMVRILLGPADNTEAGIAVL